MSDEELTPTGFIPPRTKTQPVRTTTPSGERKIAPNPDAPKVKRRASELEAAHQASAEGYDALESASENVKKMANEIDGIVSDELMVSDSVVLVLSHAILKKGDK